MFQKQIFSCSIQRNKSIFNQLRLIQSNIPGQWKERSTEVSFSDGKTLKLSTGKYAKMANGSVLATIGDTCVNVTVVAGKSPAPGSFVPLIVDYRQKASSIGRIPVNFFRRDAAPTEKEIITSRIIDRSLRPLFPEYYNLETQIVCNTIAVDSINNPDIVSINAASMALSLSDIPWNGPVGAVRLGMIDNELLINPTKRQLEKSVLNLVISATKHNLVVMLEGQADNILLQDLLKAIKKGTQEAQNVIASIEKLQKEIGKPKRPIDVPPQLSEEVQETINVLSQTRVREIFTDFKHDKLSRDDALNAVRLDVLAKVKENFPGLDPNLISDRINRTIKRGFRSLILDENVRCDGRRLNELRHIECEINRFNTLHGDALFQRGQTQTFCTVTLDSHQSALKLDPVTSMMSGAKEKNFFLHYEFPPYATKEIGRVGLIGRRETGHGALAERGLNPIIPKDFPFTIRLLSEVFESNGSSSMASVCCGSLALVDAGVPIHAPAAGVAMGLITKYSNNDTKHLEDYRILTDLLGIEDYLGDMDFKMAGTKKGLTALQADIKIPGVPLKVVMEAVQQGHEAKNRILDIMGECIGEPRKQHKENWPVRETLKVEPHNRARFIGVGGMNLKKIFLNTGVQLNNIDENVWEVFAPSQDAMNEAKEMISSLLEDVKAPELEQNGIYTAKIVEIRDTGVMVTLYPGMTPAFLHNTQLDLQKISHPSVLGLDVGDEIQIKYFGRDPVSGMMRLSRKALQMTVR